MLDALLQDLRYAFRALRSSPGFAAVAILSLALGIGANTAIFSLIDSVILKTLPVTHPEQLLQVTMAQGTRIAPTPSGSRCATARMFSPASSPSARTGSTSPLAAKFATPAAIGSPGTSFDTWASKRP